ncbi:MAG: hypothetical protein E5V63_23830 [Mesorhizobium sp.]|nr:MAG: hypothetical protein E5V63_23830 [Mesorhizobium sp.]
MAKQQTDQHHNLAAERMVLGKVLQSESSFWAISDVLQAFHFYNEFHQRVFQNVRDILTEGKRVSLAILESRLGPEYDDDGKSTSSFLTALLRDAENNESALEEVEGIVDAWRHRKLIETLEHGLKEAKKPNVMPADLLSDMEVKIKDINVNSQAEPLKWIGDIAGKVLTRSAKTKDTGIIPGFDTGLPDPCRRFGFHRRAGRRRKDRACLSIGFAGATLYARRLLRARDEGRGSYGSRHGRRDQCVGRRDRGRFL